MLEEIREGSSGWFAWIIAAIIIIPMGFWGISDYISPNPQVPVAKVGDEEIQKEQFIAQLRIAQNRQRANMGGQVNEELLSSNVFKQSVLQQMINQVVLESIANEQDYRVGNGLLTKVIHEVPLFQKEGKFDPSLYENYIQSTGRSSAQFENNIRNDIRLNQVASGYEDSALVLPDEVKRLLQIQATLRAYNAISIDAQSLVAQQTVNEEEIEQYYQDNSSLFEQQERLSIDFVELNLAQEMEKIQLDEAELNAIYQNAVSKGSSAYTTQETRKASHILLLVDESHSDKEQKAKAQEYVEQLQAGADFVALAKEVSQDPGSASNGGDLGVIERKQMVAAFEDAVYSLAVGEISAPIKTEFGYHIITVTDINAPRVRSFEEVKATILEEEKLRLAEEALVHKVDTLRNLAFEHPDSLDAIVKEFGVKVQQSALFTRNQGEGIAENNDVRTAAFSDEIVLDALNSEPIALPNERYVVLRKREYTPASVKKLAEVKDDIKTLIQTEKARTQVQALGEALVQTAKSGWDSAIRTVKQDKAYDKIATISEGEFSLSSNSSNLPFDMIESLLAVQSDQVNTSDAVRAKMSNNGNYYIVQVTAVTEGNLSTMSEQIKQQVRQLVAARNGRAVFESYIEAMRKELGTEVQDENL